MPVKIHFPGTTYSQNKAAIKAAFPKSCRWDAKGRRGWFGKDLSITAHLRSGEPGTLYLEGKKEYIDLVVNACKNIVASCEVEIVDHIPEFEFMKAPGVQKQPEGKYVSSHASLTARINNEKIKLKASGMSDDFIKKWIALIRKEYEERINIKN